MLPTAISPCPNDTFLFYAWIKGEVGKELACEPHFYDIQQLNQLAAKKKFPLIKLSFYALSKLLDDYELLPIGAALGKGQGPKIISKTPFSLEELSKKRIAIPGKQTTAHLLLDLLAPKPKAKHFCLYHEVEESVAKGKVDCGLIIHESRFTYEKAGFYEICDFGLLYEKLFQSPLPLGGLALRKDYLEQKETIISILEESLAFARAHPEKCRDFILQNSQEKDPAVVQAHIDLYVNEQTRHLSKEGYAAIDRLFELARDIG